MKKIILLITVALAHVAGAQTSNLLNYVNTGSGANTGTGDPLRTAFGKINGNFVMLSGVIDALPTGGSTNTPSVAVTNVVSLTNGAVPYVTNLGNSIAAVFQFGIPAGAPGTNTVTAYNFTNQVLASRQILVYSTNYAYWDRVSNGSNYLGRFNGLVDFNIWGGDNGGNPPFSINVSLWGSLNGSNGWFQVTNNYVTTNLISLAVVTNGSPYTIANPGGATIWTMDHWELYSRTNYFDYQKFRINTAPSDDADLANKRYVDTMVANVKEGGFSSYSSNGLSHFVYSYQNRVVFDITSSTTWIPLKGSSTDGSYTHILVDVYQTNLTSGYDFQSSTNLSIIAGFTSFTNYTLSTNSGVVTFTVPINISEPARFFRIISSIAAGAAFNVPLTLNGGMIYTSNTWILATVSNALPNFGFWVGNSNGQALVTLWRSNAAGYYLTWSNGVAVKTPAW